MNIKSFKCFSALLFSILALALGSAAYADGSDHRHGNISHAAVKTLAVPGVQEAGNWAGRARLRPSDDGVRITVKSQRLGAGVAYTVWVAIFNNPHECATNPCTGVDLGNGAVEGSLQNLTGRVANEYGRASFEAFLPVGFMHTNPASGALRHILGPGLQDPNGAEIHLIVRCHGPWDGNPEQLSTFGGSCSADNPCFDAQVVVFPRPRHRHHHDWMDD